MLDQRVPREENAGPGDHQWLITIAGQHLDFEALVHQWLVPPSGQSKESKQNSKRSHLEYRLTEFNREQLLTALLEPAELLRLTVAARSKDHLGVVWKVRDRVSDVANGQVTIGAS
ncbi:hypothetical protein VRZ08_04105 [Rhodopseudomonas sp. G2_2311]|uniref:hypothetical protein n=1 Tax=Rhodopseudomonas sp. G2_2311 TaxID=3114287 RepID=UPI0039C71F31